MEKVRVDKWLWSVRIFKSRTMATNACKRKRIKVDNANVKPSQLVQVGDVVNVHKNGFDLVFKIEKLIDKRVSATRAIPCYTDLTPEGELNKFRDWYIGKAQPEIRKKGDGRPTKKDRRELEEYKDTQFFYDMWDEDDEI